MVSILIAFLLVPVSQSPRDTIRQHYEAAEMKRRAGDLVAAETEYGAILGEAYGRLGKIYSAQKAHKSAVEALETAALYGGDSQEVLLDLAIAYFNAEQLEKAVQPLAKALALDPRNAGAHHMLGKTYFMMGELQKSIDELERALKITPNDYDASYTLGLAYLKGRQLAPAKRIYDQMLKQLGDRPQLHVLFGRSYRETGFLAEAIEEFKRAIALDSHFPRVHYYLGLTSLLKDGPAALDSAAEEFKIELASHPDEFFANYYLGIIFITQRKWDLAIGLLESAARIQSNNPDPYFFLGEAYQAIGKHDQAIDVLRKSITFSPSLDHNDYQVATAHYRLGQSLRKTGRAEEGEKELQISLALKSEGHKRDEEKTSTYLNSSTLHQQNGNFPEILSVEGIVAESNAPDEKTAAELKSGAAYYVKVIASAHNNIGMLRAERQNFRGAAEQFAQAARWNPQLEAVNFNWGLAYYKAELYREAIPSLENELKVNPNNLRARQFLGLSYFMADNYARASALLGDVISAATDDAGLYYALAVSLLKQGKQEPANSVIRQTVANSGSSPKFHILLGQAYYEQGDTENSLLELKAALALDDKTRLAHYYSGLIYLKLGKFDEAIEEFQKELVLNPNDLDARFHLGFVLLAGQKSERGVKLMREVIQLKPDYGEAHYELGKALLQQGDIKGAVVSLEAAAELKPDEAYVHYQLGRAYLQAGRKAEGESHIEISRQLKEKARSQANQQR